MGHLKIKETTLSVIQMSRRACDRCRGLRKRCDCRDGVYPCSRCVNNGAECTHSASTKTQTRQRSDDQAPPVETKRKRQPKTDPAKTFWSALADTWLLASLVKLGPTHWGLRNVAYALMARAYAKGSSELLARATSFIQRIGLGLSHVSGPISHQVQHTVSTTFDGIHQTPLDAQDRILGYAPEQWTQDHLKERIILATVGLSTGHGRIALSQSFHNMVNANILERLCTSPNPMMILSEQLFEEHSFHRGLQACIYIMTQYHSKTCGPLSVKVPDFHLKNGQIFDLYITYWVEQLDNFVRMYEFVPVGLDVAQQDRGQQAVSMEDILEESLAAAHALTNLMKK